MPDNDLDLTAAPAPYSASRGRMMLLAIAVATVVVWHLPWGNYILWPFTILSTWFHEMGHGLTAIVLGGDFERLEISSDGSGLATHQGRLWLGRVGRALVAAGGLVAPSIAGGLMLLASRRPGSTRWCLYALGLTLALSAFLWVRGAFALPMVMAYSAIVLSIAVSAGPRVQRVTLQILAVQSCVALYRDLGYFFTGSVEVGGQTRHSDTGTIAQQLFLPHWFWAVLVTAFSVVVLLAAIGAAYGKDEDGGG